MPVAHVGGYGDYIAGTDHLCGLSFLLHQAEAGHNNQCLAKWMGVPRRASLCFEGHCGATNTPRW